MKEHLDDDRIHTISDGRMDKLQRLLGVNCFNYIKTKYDLIIFGDSGRPIITDKVLPGVIAATLGKVGDDIYIPFILDDDGVGYAGLKKVISDKLRSIPKDKSKFISNQFPTLKTGSDSFTLSPLKGRGSIEVRLSTVPESLETQVARRCIEVKCPNSKILEKGPHYAVDFLAMEYYSGDKEKLIRNTSALLKDEAWVTDVVDRVN